MDSIFIYLQSLIENSVAFLNQPAIKEEIKNLTSLMVFLFGIVELIFLCFKPSEPHKSFIRVLAGISIFLSALITRQSIALVSYLISNPFGNAALFAVDPWNPKHVISIAAIFLAIPALVHQKSVSKRMLFVLTFNTLTSRPVLHLTNYLAHLLINL